MDEEQPAAPEAPPPSDPARSPARTVGLAAIAFFGTLIVLAGLALGFRGVASSGAPDATTTAAASSPSPSVAVPPSPEATGSYSPGASASAAASSGPTPSPSGDPVLVGAGDIATCNLDGDEATAKLIDRIPGTVFTAGDNAYDAGTADEFANCYAPTWGRFKDRTRPAAGNHDWGTADAQGYRDYFGQAAVNPEGETWYSYELGTWHIVVLDANCAQVGGCGAGSKQAEWLAADLAAADPARCTMAIWHQPRFSSGDEHGNDPSVDPFWRALYAAGADVVVNGHDHDYERFAPQDPEGREDRARGIREFVVGTGGADIRGFDAPQPNSELRMALGPGVITFTLHDRSYDWAWTGTETQVTDSGSGPCH